jgi:CRISPR-associated protein Csb1
MTGSILSFVDLLSAPRVVIEAALEPLVGTRLQPTGFPNLGAAEFIDPSGATSLIVQSTRGDGVG